MIRCPLCLWPGSRVYYIRRDKGFPRRCRWCRHCGSTWRTIELTEPTDPACPCARRSWVLESRPIGQDGIRRRRECGSCERRWSTFEVPVALMIRSFLAQKFHP